MIPIFCVSSLSNIKSVILVLVFAHFYLFSHSSWQSSWRDQKDPLAGGTKMMEMCKYEDQNDGFYIRWTKRVENTK